MKDGKKETMKELLKHCFEEAEAFKELKPFHVNKSKNALKSVSCVTSAKSFFILEREFTQQ